MYVEEPVSSGVSCRTCAASCFDTAVDWLYATMSVPGKMFVPEKVETAGVGCGEPAGPTVTPAGRRATVPAAMPTTASSVRVVTPAGSRPRTEVSAREVSVFTAPSLQPSTSAVCCTDRSS
jgi:hypothetical protein